MGKLKKNSKSSHVDALHEHENGLDWEQLLVGYQNQTTDELLENLMNKVSAKRIKLEIFNRHLNLNFIK